MKEQTLENLIYIKLKEIELERFDFKVNKQRVNKFINRVSGNNKEVNLSEIEIFQNDEFSNSDLISRIFDEIRKYGFEDTALKFSVSSSSSEKGNLGWINIKTLSKKINNVLKNLKPGQVSKPIIQTNSILFIKLNSERILENNDIDEELLKKNLIRRKQDELFNLYSRSHLSKLKNNSLIEYK